MVGLADVGVLCGLVHDHIQENKACQPVLHAKHKPEYPDRAFSGGVLRQLLFGYNGFSTDFIRLRYSGKDWMIQLSESVPSVCTTHKLLSSKDFPLDTTSFTQEFLFALLLNPEVVRVCLLPINGSQSRVRVHSRTVTPSTTLRSRWMTMNEQMCSWYQLTMTGFMSLLLTTPGGERPSLVSKRSCFRYVCSCSSVRITVVTDFVLSA